MVKCLRALFSLRQGFPIPDFPRLDRYNCQRTAYDYDALLEAGRWLMEDDVLRKRLQDNGLKYAERSLDWDGIMPMIEDAYGVRG